MNLDEKFEMTWREFYQIIADRDKKLLEAVDLFVSIVKDGLQAYPQGELHDFLASKTALYAALANGKVIDLAGDPRDFFKACGFDSEMIERMVVMFELALKIDKKLNEFEVGKVVE